MSIVTFGVVLTMLMMDTVLSVMDVNNAIREITSTLTSTSSQSFKERYDGVALSWPIDNALYAWMVNVSLSLSYYLYTDEDDLPLVQSR